MPVKLMEISELGNVALRQLSVQKKTTRGKKTRGNPTSGLYNMSSYITICNALQFRPLNRLDDHVYIHNRDDNIGSCLVVDK